MADHTLGDEDALPMAKQVQKAMKNTLTLKHDGEAGFQLLINGEDVFAGQVSRLRLALDAEDMMPILRLDVPLGKIDVEIPECVVAVRDSQSAQVTIEQNIEKMLAELNFNLGQEAELQLEPEAEDKSSDD
jgi:hypothetical protein